MAGQDLNKRYRAFAIGVALLIQQLPKNAINYAYCNQLIRASSSPGANYRAACRAKSNKDFLNKLKIVEEELDESIFFLDLLKHFNSKWDESFDKQLKEANELLSITVASIRSARAKIRTNKPH